MASDDWPDERARATAVVGSQGLDEPGGGRTYTRQIHDRADPGSWDAESQQSRRNLTIPIGASVIVLTGFALAVWYAYNWGLEDGSRMEVPLIKAEEGPVKVKPDDPGGLTVPNQETLVLNQDGSGEETLQVERLLPEPETPQPLEPLEQSSASVPRPSDAQVLGNEVASAEPAPDESAAADSPTGTSPQLAEAPLPSTGQSAVDQTQPGRATSAPSGGESTGTAAPVQTAQSQAPAEPQPAKTQPAKTQPAKTQPARTEPAKTQPAKTQVTELKSGDTVIQLASVASGEAASREWARLQAAYPDLLGDMPLAVQKVTVNGKEYHRMQTGPFPNRATAQDMCAQLKAQKQACLVTKR